MLTLELTLAMLAGGALAAAAVGAVDAGTGVPAPLALQAAVGLAVALGGLFLLRPVALRHMHRSTPGLRTGAARLVGADAVVLERVDPKNGRVKLDGEVWSARSYDGFSVFESGADVSVLHIDGATALVG